MKYFLDTSFVIALFNKNDKYHHKSIKLRVTSYGLRVKIYLPKTYVSEKKEIPMQLNYKILLMILIHFIFQMRLYWKLRIVFLIQHSDKILSHLLKQYVKMIISLFIQLILK